MSVDMTIPYAELCIFGNGVFHRRSRIWLAGGVGFRYWIGTESNNPDSTLATGLLTDRTFVDVPNDVAFLVRVRSKFDSWETWYAIDNNNLLRAVEAMEHQ